LASPVKLKLGMKLAIQPHYAEQSSYFFTDIALLEKIISSGLEGSTRSTDHDDLFWRSRQPGADLPLLARHLRGPGRGDLHRSRRRGPLPARPLVTCDVDRHYGRRTAAVAAAPLHRSSARARAAVRDRLLRQADRAVDQQLRQGQSSGVAEYRICSV